MAAEDKKQRIKGFIQRGKGEALSKEAPAVSLFSKRELYIPLVAALVTTYIHFWGYAYLKGKLEKVGFDGLEIELTLLESIYQSALSLANIFVSITKTDASLFLATIVGLVIYVYLLNFLNHLTNEQSSQEKRQTKIIEQSGSLLRLRNAFFKINHKSLTQLALIILGSFLILCLLILLTIPYGFGSHHAEEYIKAKRCTHFYWDEVKAERIKGCTKLTLKNQDTISGEVIFKNKELTVFTTGDVSYLLDSSNNIIATTHFHSNPNIQEESPAQEPKP